MAEITEEQFKTLAAQVLRITETVNTMSSDIGRMYFLAGAQAIIAALPADSEAPRTKLAHAFASQMAAIVSAETLDVFGGFMEQSSDVPGADLLAKSAERTIKALKKRIEELTATIDELTPSSEAPK